MARTWRSIQRSRRPSGASARFQLAAHRTDAIVDVVFQLVCPVTEFAADVVDRLAQVAVLLLELPRSRLGLSGLGVGSALLQPSIRLTSTVSGSSSRPRTSGPEQVIFVRQRGA